MKKSKLGKTPFYEAVESGDYETFSLLLDAGANVNDIMEATLVILRAVSLGHQETVEVLFNLHADVKVSDSSGSTCLQVAGMRDHIVIVHKGI